MKTYLPQIERRILVRPNQTFGILNYDMDNAYPQRMLELVAGSPTAKDCWNKRAKFIAGSLDNIKDQQLANNVFDCSVNQGTGLAGKFMQVACNYVITAYKVAVKPLIIDRQIGRLILAVFNGLPAAQLNAEINAEREASYRSDSQYAEWGKVWEKRLKQYNNL